MKVSFILPSYNEHDHIVIFIREIERSTEKENVDYEIILVDDNSPDKTGEHVEETFRNSKNVKVIIRKNEKGLATAILRGIDESAGTHIVLMDTDFNHDPKYLKQFFDLAKYYDIVTGSRYTWGGNMEGGRARYIGSMIFNYFLSLILSMKSTDNTGGFVLFKKSILEKMNTKKIFKGYGEFYFRFLLAAQYLEKSCIEIPVVYGLRASGASKTYFGKYIFIYTFEGLKLLFRGKSLIKK